ncbi:disulfide isomerase DsbC N-terminal domain-containing protein [Thalassotalea marina]|uniref:Thiol:disulfide interchange protein DsbC n=1 Tax=Thalassotalea marina TaxID=1673741 RepID=A0A919BQT8_9GAMM|nr:disulfide isomerase DsbC N-terminal domain-containing protein [Thalassotalea marina]GHG07046.1 thiol:disulfide interchange protein [Thalassotalea marina]
MRFYSIVFVLLFSAFSNAVEVTTKAEQLIRSVLPNTKIDGIEESEMPGIYMITSGANIFYFHLEKKLLVFGEIMTTTGKNLTKPNREKALNQSLSSASQHALTIQYGEPINVVYEFTNPECGACLGYEKYLKENPFKDTVRHIFFLGWSEASERKLEHIMCSKDKQAAKELVYNGGVIKEFASCEYGRGLVAKHKRFASSMGVDRTPTLIINGTKMVGLRVDQFKTLLMESKTHEQLRKETQSD